MLGSSRGYEVTQGVTARYATSAGRARRTVDVEALLAWAYQDQKVHLATGWAPGFDGGGRSGDGVATAIEADRLGCFVDGGDRWMGFDVHPDAETVHRVAAGGRDRLEPGSAAWWAERGMRPDCRPGWRPSCGPVWKGPEGRIVGGRVMSGKLGYLRNRHGDAVACMIELDPMPIEVVEAGRREYARWHADLVRIAAGLQRAGLRDWSPTGPSAPAAPWRANSLDHPGDR